MCPTHTWHGMGMGLSSLACGVKGNSHPLPACPHSFPCRAGSGWFCWEEAGRSWRPRRRRRMGRRGMPGWLVSLLQHVFYTTMVWTGQVEGRVQPSYPSTPSMRDMITSMPGMFFIPRQTEQTHHFPHLSYHFWTYGVHALSGWDNSGRRSS